MKVIIAIMIFFLPFTLFSEVLDGTNSPKIVTKKVVTKKAVKLKKQYESNDFNDKKENLGSFNEEKKEKEDSLSFLAPENFIGIIYFIILVGGLLVLKKIFFDTEKVEK